MDFAFTIVLAWLLWRAARSDFSARPAAAMETDPVDVAGAVEQATRQARLVAAERARIICAGYRDRYAPGPEFDLLAHLLTDGDSTMSAQAAAGCFAKAPSPAVVVDAVGVATDHERSPLDPGRILNFWTARLPR